MSDHPQDKSYFHMEWSYNYDIVLDGHLCDPSQPCPRDFHSHNQINGKCWSEIPPGYYSDQHRNTWHEKVAAPSMVRVLTGEIRDNNNDNRRKRDHELEERRRARESQVKRREVPLVRETRWLEFDRRRFMSSAGKTKIQPKGRWIDYQTGEKIRD